MRAVIEDRRPLPPRVVGLWHLDVAPFSPGELHYVAPDTCTDVVLLREEGRETRIVVSPPTIHFALVPLVAGSAHLGARVQPGYGSFLLRDPAALGDVPRRFTDGEHAKAWLVDRLGHLTAASRHAPPDWIVEALRLVSVWEGPTDGRIGMLAREVGASPRTLRRGLSQWVGLSPKKLLRLQRARRALALLAAGKRLAEIAFELGFSDQAHMTRELRATVGVSPGDVRKRAGWPIPSRSEAGAPPR